MPVATVLIVEAETLIAEGLISALEQLDYEVTAAVATGEEAIERVLHQAPEIILMDIHLAGALDGIQAAKIIKARLPLPILFLTVDTTDETLARARKINPCGYLLKPFKKSDLKLALETALQAARTETEQKRIRAEKRSLEKQLHQHRRLEALGTLAGGIAHDFNNILSSIVGFTEIALYQELPPHSPAADSLHQVLQAADRAKKIIKQLSAFSRRGSNEKKPLAIAPLVKETVKLLELSLPPNIHLQTRIATDLAPVCTTPDQIQQVILNLFTNAAEAMVATGGELTITLESLQLAGTDNSLRLDLAAGAYVLLTVTDTGRGMAPETRERIFDPYFSTKPKTDGAGMGLPIALGIAKDGGGQISVESRLATGTVVRVAWPSILPEKEASSNNTCVPRGGGRILFIDDEPMIVIVAQKMLAYLGYETTTQTDDPKALETFRQNPDAFDLVITDYYMPEMTGDVISKEIKRIRPDIPILLFTGIGDVQTIKDFQRAQFDGILTKPVERAPLARTLRRLLAGSKRL